MKIAGDVLGDDEILGVETGGYESPDMMADGRGSYKVRGHGNG